jgi:hypothetical protein
VTAQASTALSDVLAQAGLAIRTLAPNVTRSTNELSIDASGVEVSFTQPATLPGVPRQQVVQQLGDVLNDSLAVAGVPLTASPGATSPASSPSSSGSTSIFIPGTPAIPGTPGTPGTPAASGGAGAGNSTASSSALGAPRLIVHKTKPLDLVLLYFLWQSLIIGTVASLWWRRLELAEAEA